MCAWVLSDFCLMYVGIRLLCMWRLSSPIEDLKEQLHCPPLSPCHGRVLSLATDPRVWLSLVCWQQRHWTQHITHTSLWPRDSSLYSMYAGFVYCISIPRVLTLCLQCEALHNTLRTVEWKLAQMRTSLMGQNVCLIVHGRNDKGTGRLVWSWTWQLHRITLCEDRLSWDRHKEHFRVSKSLAWLRFFLLISALGM